MVEKASVAEVEAAAWLAIFAAALRAVVETPTRGPAGNRSAQVGEEIVGARLPLAVAATKRFLVENGRHTSELIHDFNRGKSFGLCLRG